MENKILKGGDFCNNIDINGIINSDFKSIQEKINTFCNDKNYDIEKLKNEFFKDPWLKNVYIKKILPNGLLIDIIEYYPFAIVYYNKNEYYLIDQFSNKIDVSKDELNKFKNLLIVSGKDFEKEINNFFNLLSIYPNITNNIYKIERIGSRRWNVILKNRLIIKLPEENEDIFNIWKLLEKLLKTYGLNADLEEIDLRIKGKIYLKYKENTIKEMENL